MLDPKTGFLASRFIEEKGINVQIATEFKNLFVCTEVVCPFFSHVGTVTASSVLLWGVKDTTRHL